MIRPRHLAVILGSFAALRAGGQQVTGDGARRGLDASLISVEITPAVEFPLEPPVRPLFGLGYASQLAGRLPLPFLPLVSPQFGISYTYMPVRADTSISVIGFGVGGRLDLELGRRFVLSATGLGGGYYASFNENRLDPEGVAYANQSGAAGYVATGAALSFFLTPWASLSVAGSYHNYLGLYQSIRAGIGTTLHIEGFQRKVRLRGITTQPVFPVLLQYYGDHSLGEATLRNDERFPITNVEVTLYVPEYMEQPRRATTAQTLRPGQSAPVTLYGLFKESALGLKEDSQLPVQLQVRYTMNGRRRELSVTEKIQLHHRNAMTWDDDRKAAAFVSAKDPEILRYAKSVAGIVRSAGPASIDLNLRMGMGVFASLHEYRLSYVVDPNTPAYVDASKSASIVDFLQFPKQTLDYKGGDCDDLAILYCALLEAIGVPTAFITVPEHIFAAFSTGMTEEEARATFSDQTRFVVQDGQAWVPVETTLVGASFQDAWRSGAERWNASAANGAARLYPTESSWQLYPSAAWPAEGEPLRIPDEEAVAASYRQTVGAFAEAELFPQEEKLRREIGQSTRPARLLNRLGVLYARYGLTDKAKDVFAETLRLGDYVPAIANLGTIVYLEGDLQGALELFERALRLDPEDSTVLLNLARTSYELKEYARARSYFGQLAVRSPELSREFAYLGSMDSGGSRAEDIEGLKSRMLWREESGE
jgi:hypothetical protein